MMRISLAYKLHRVAEIVGVQHAALEGVESRDTREYVGCREVAGGNDHVIEFLGVFDVFLMILHGDVEHAFVLVVTARGAPVN